MNLINKIQLEEIPGGIHSVLSATSSIVRTSPIVLEVSHECPPNVLRMKVETVPAVLLSLYEHHFYLRLLGGRDRTNSDMYFDRDEFETVRDILPSLFQQAVLSEACYTDSQRSFCLVTVRGITPLGEAVVSGMQADRGTPKELERLYCAPFCMDTQSKPGLYALSKGAADAEYLPSPFINAVLRDRSIRGLDISCLSMQQCERDGLLQFLVSKIASPYLQVDVYPKSQIRMKRVFWKENGFHR